MSRRSPNPTSCAATTSAHVGQGHHTRIRADYRTRSGRPPPLTRRPLPCRALVEAAQHACRSGSPDLELYQSVRERAGAQRATLTAARKIARRCFHTLTAAEAA
jgi:transposase